MRSAVLVPVLLFALAHVALGNLRSNADTRSATVTCPAGSFASSASMCSYCPVGYYQPSAGTQTSCLACPVGTASSNAYGATSCTPCSAGTFAASTGSSSCPYCPSGSYQPSTGSAACIPCPAGKASSVTWGATSCSTCSAGRYAPPLAPGAAVGASVCTSCPAGSDAPTAGASQCNTCAIGKYAPYSGTASCSSCSPGYYSAVAGATSCTVCPIAYYQPSAGQASCLMCPAGTWSTNSWGATSCSNCNAGQYSSAGSQSCTNCAAGAYQPTPAQASCILCPAGSYSAVTWGATSCSLCSVGTSSAAGASQCTACAPGTVNAVVGGVCTPCVAGKYQSLSGQSACPSCPVGRVSSSPGAASCSACPVGTFAGSTGLQTCSQCAAGRFANVAGSSTCGACAAGYFSAAGAATCTACPAGSSSAAGSSACNMCSIGKYAPTPASLSCLDCPAGQISTAVGSASCTSCPAGSFASSSGQSSCTQCPAGTYQSAAGSNSCLACPAGTYAPAGSSVCTPCAPGSFSASAASSCTLCPAGSFAAAAGSLQCALCQPGTVQSNPGSAACDICPANTYQPLLGQSSCTACPADVSSTHHSVLIQDGLNGYASTEAVSLTTINGLAAWNAFNGLSFMPGVDASTDPGHSMSGMLSLFNNSYGANAVLLRFNALNTIVPPGASILSAKLYLTVRTYSTNFVIRGQYVATSWSSTACCGGAASGHIGWAYRDAQLSQWAAPGVTGAADVSSLGDFNITGFPSLTYGYAVKAVQLDPRIVQQWIASPSQNNGVLFTMASAGASADLLTAGLSSMFPGLRPQLVLDVEEASACAGAQPAPVIVGATHYVSGPRDWFVNPAVGNDITGSGLAAHPFATLAKALQLALPFDTIWLVGGNHPGGFSLYLPNITIRSAPGTRARIASARDSNVGIVIQIRDTASGSALIDLDIAGSYHYGVLVDNVFGTRVGPTDVLIQGCTVHDTGNTGIKVKSGAHRVHIINNRVVRTGSRIRTYGHGIDVLGVDDALIADNFVSDVANNGIAVSAGARRAIVTRNFVNNTGNIGITLGWYQELDEMGLTTAFALTQPALYQNINGTVSDNIITDTQGAGVALFSAKNPVVAHNTLWFTAQSQMSSIMINLVQVYVAWNYQPLTPCVGVSIRDNIVARSPFARKDMVLQIRTLADVTNANNVVSGLSGPLTMSNNVYSVQGVVGAVPFQWGSGVMFEDETPGHALVGNLAMWQSFMGTDAASAQVMDAMLDAEFCPLACSAAYGTASDAGVPLDDFATAAGAVQQRNIGAVTDCAATAAKLASQLADVAAIPPAMPLPPAYTYAGFPDYIMTLFASHACKSLYVSPSGNDNNDGSIVSPWRTIARATSVSYSGATAGALPCDTIYLRAGVYTEAVRFYTPNLTLASFPGERASIVVPTNDSNIGNAIYFGTGGNVWNVPTEMTLRGLDVSGGYYYAVMFNQVGGGHSAWWDAYRQFTNKPGRGFTLIEDCYLHHSGTSVVKMSPDAGYITIRRTEIAFSGLNAGAGGRRLSTDERADVASDTLSLSEHARRLPGGAVPTDAQLASIGVSALPTGGSGNGIDSRQGSYLTIEDSYIHDIQGVGVLLGGGARNCIVRRNTLRRIGSIGIMAGSFNTEVEYMNVDDNPEFYQSIGAVIDNNIVVDVGGAGVGVYSSKDVRVAHNTLLRVARSFHAGILLNLSPELVSPWTSVVPTNKNVNITNNIVVVDRNGVHFGLEARVAAIPHSQLPPGPVPYSDPSTPSCAGVVTPGAPPVSPFEGLRNADGTCPTFPVDNAWNRDISALPKHPMSDTWMASICGCTSLPCAGCVGLHPDFGSYGSTVYGIPFVDVVAGQSTVPINILEYPTESDYPGPFPIPASAPIEGLTAASRTCPLSQCFGDRHVLVRDTDSCMLYELYHAEVVNGGASWNAGSTAVFNLTSNARRPLGWTSADASGNSVYAGLVKQAEVASGEIKHAIRMTLPVTQKAYINELASHYAAYSSDPTLPPMGLRLRLKPSFDCSALQQSARVVCVALQKYGAVIMDNGSKGYLSGEANPAFNSAELADIHQIPLSAMEAVLSGPLCTTSDCSQPNVVSQVSIPAIAAADFPSVHMSGNVWHFDTYAYEAAQSLSFVNRDPANFVYGSLSAWQSAALALGSPVDTSVEADPGLDAWLNPSSALIQSLQPVLQAVSGVSDDYYGTVRSSVPAIVPGAVAVTPAAVLNSGVSPAGWPALSLLLAPTAQCPGAPLTFSSLYVDAIGGNDSSCTPDVVATPLRSLAAALRLIAPSGTITLRAGTHATAGVVVSVPSITITSYVGETAVLRAPVSINRGSPLTLTGSANGVTLSGLEIRGGFDSGLVIDGPASVQVLGCTIHGSGGVAVDIRNSAGVVVDGCTVKSSGQMNAPDGHGITLTNSPAAHLHANYIDSTRAFGIVVDYGSQSSVVSRNQIVNCGGGVSVGPVRQPDLGTNAVVCASSAAHPICYRVSGALIANNLILSTRGSGLHLAGTTGVQAVHNTLVRCGLAMGAGVELAALQLWDATTSAGQIVSNDATLLQNNIVVTAPLSALPVLSVSSQQPWAGGASVPGVQWATATLSNNLFYKDPTIEAANYTNLFYTLNAKTGSPANSGYGSLSVSSNDPYVLDTGLPWPYRYSVQSWNTQRSAVNAVGSPGFSSEYIPSSALAAAGSADAAACALVDEAVDLLGRARTCASASIGALEPVAAITTPAYASVGLAQPGPGSCMAPRNDAAACSPPNCYHAWQSSPAPAGLDNAAIYSKCLANGAMFSGAGSEWSRDVSALPVHPLSDSYVASIGLGKGIHPDFGSQYGGDMMGIPTVVVNSAFPRTPVSFLYNTESDNVGYPIPTAPMEGGECTSNGDRHMLVLEKDTCTIYELYQLYRYDPAYWSSVGVSAWAQAGAVFSTSSNGVRPNTQGWTSADAAGLSVYAGLVHWYEVYGLGAINHAIRMTIAHPQRAYVSPPATHLVGSATDAGLPAMGQRFRLKQSYDCIANLVSVEARIVCAAMKKYGTIVADIGSDWFISGEAHPGWNDANVSELKNIQSNFFEAVLTGGQMCTDAGCV